MNLCYRIPLVVWRGGDGMATYRIYLYGPDGHIAGSHAFLCDNDDEAIELGKAQADGRPMELWEAGRKVKTYDTGGIATPDDTRSAEVDLATAPLGESHGDHPLSDTRSDG
jgi:hypothetical protein